VRARELVLEEISGVEVKEVYIGEVLVLSPFLITSSLPMAVSHNSSLWTFEVSSTTNHFGFPRKVAEHLGTCATASVTL
jgi:hypothetical protein